MVKIQEGEKNLCYKYSKYIYIYDTGILQVKKC